MKKTPPTERTTKVLVPPQLTGLEVLESPHAKHPLAFAFAALPAAKLRVPLAVLDTPPATVLPGPLAMPLMPPLTVLPFIVASFEMPPPTVLKGPLAVLLSPPPTVLRSP